MSCGAGKEVSILRRHELPFAMQGNSKSSASRILAQSVVPNAESQRSATAQHSAFKMHSRIIASATPAASS
jgi:hypothetical protein